MATQKDKKIKLSDKQKEVISRLRDGEIMHYMTGLNSYCFWSKTYKNVSWATIGRLEYLKLIERTKDKVELTELGKTIDL